MKKLRTLLLAFALLPAGQALSANLDVPYTPTRGEWLTLYLAENIKVVTDDWPIRVRVMVTVVDKTQQVMVTLKLARGEKKPSPEERDASVKAVTDLARRAIESYPWSKDLKVSVLFV